MFPPFYLSWFQHPPGTIFVEEYKLRRSSLSLPCVQMFSSALWSQIPLICVRHVEQRPKLVTRLHRNISMDVIRYGKRVSSVSAVTRRRAAQRRSPLYLIDKLRARYRTCAEFWMLYSFFWVIPLPLNFMCRRFGTLYLFRLMDGVSTRKMEDRVFRNVGT